MNSKTAKKLQQEFCNYFGFKQDIIWDRYEQDEKSALEIKINLALPLPEEKEEADKVKKIIDNIIKSLWDQRKYSGGSLLMSQIFIISVKYNDDDVELSSSSIKSIENCTEFQVHTVFRVRKCIKEQESHDCCMIFVDENGRVYENWVDYKNNNQLPKSFLIAPRNGIYQSDGDDDQVFLEIIKSPACSIGQKVLKVADTSSIIIGGLGATAAIFAGILSAPISAPVVAGAAVVGGVCGGYSAFRSGERLVDRATHEQSIALDDAEARGHWFGIAAGVGSVVAGGVTRVVGSMAKSGIYLTPVMHSTLNVINATAVTVNGVKVVNGFLGVIKYKDSDKIEVLDVVQLSASLFLFTHSVYNFRTAANIIRTNQEQTVQGFRDDLSRNNKRMFDRMSKETVRTQGGLKGRAEIIRSLKSIPDKNLYLRGVNKQLNQNNDSPLVKSTVSAILLANDKIFSEDFLNELLENLSKLMSEDAFVLFIEFVNKFVSKFGKKIESEHKRIIPFEDFLSDAFKVITKAAAGKENAEDISSFIVDELKKPDIYMEVIVHFLRYYDKFQPKGDLDGKCKKCGGKFYINFYEK